MFSDGLADYVSLTDIANAWDRGRKSIKTWMKNKQTLEFLNVWEKKHNPNYIGTNFGTVLKEAKDANSNISIKFWIDTTNAIGIFTRAGEKAGTYAHKDIAIRFTGWLNPEFELYLVEEIQRLTKIEEQKNSLELLNHEQILWLIRLKEVFKYVAHQELIQDVHKEVFAAKSGSKNPFAEFHNWRNEILGLSPAIIDQRIKEYCEKNSIALTKKILSKSKHEKLLLLDSYEAVRNATWDFLQIKGEVNALTLANLVGDIIRTEKGEILRSNEDNLFQTKQDLGQFSNFQQDVSKMREVRSARELLALKEAKKKEPLSSHNKALKTALNYNPKEDK
jgi:hypothetical protein